jgi:hypothetical protein
MIRESGATAVIKPRRQQMTPLRPPGFDQAGETMTGHDAVALICEEARMLRLQAAEPESRTTQATRATGQPLLRCRALVERLRENHHSLRQAADDPSRCRPQGGQPDGSAR